MKVRMIPSCSDCTSSSSVAIFNCNMSTSISYVMFDACQHKYCWPTSKIQGLCCYHSTSISQQSLFTYYCLVLYDTTHKLCPQAIRAQSYLEIAAQRPHLVVRVAGTVFAFLQAKQGMARLYFGRPRPGMPATCKQRLTQIRHLQPSDLVLYAYHHYSYERSDTGTSISQFSGSITLTIWSFVQLDVWIMLLLP